MDYNRLREGTTVYLPVYQPGALLLLAMHMQPKEIVNWREMHLKHPWSSSSPWMLFATLRLACPTQMMASHGCHRNRRIARDALRNSTTAMATYLERNTVSIQTKLQCFWSTMRYDLQILWERQVSVVGGCRSQFLLNFHRERQILTL